MTTHAAHSSSLSAVAVTAVATAVDISGWLVARGLSSCSGRDKSANCRFQGRFCFYGAMFPAAGMVCSSSGNLWTTFWQSKMHIVWLKKKTQQLLEGVVGTG